MTLEEKIGQLLMVHFNGENANEDARILIQKLHVGGVVYYNWANGLYSPEQVLSLSLGLQEFSSQNRIPLPLFIAVDQEGGVVARLTHGFTIFPGNCALGMTKDPKLAEQCAYAIGQELRAVGVNFNLSPVVDVNNNPCNSVIGIRSFGDSIETVIPFVRHTLKGYREAGILTSLKHFPPHGEITADSHHALPVIKKSKKQLDAADFLLFHALAGEAESIMAAHIVVASIDPIHCATLSESVLDILKKEIGFEGIIIADSFVMEGFLKNNDSIEEAAIQAFNAGCDILLLAGKQFGKGAHANFELTITDIEHIHQRLVDAVQKGRISEKRVDEAVHKILRLKNHFPPGAPKKEEIDFLVNTPEHKVLAHKIASLALRSIENHTRSPSSTPQRTVALIAPKIMQETINQTSLPRLGEKIHCLFFETLNPSKDEIRKAKKFAKQADVLIFCSYNTWQNRSQAILANALFKTHKQLIILSLRDPTDLFFFPKADLIVTTFSPTLPSVQAAYEFVHNFVHKRFTTSLITGVCR